VRIILGGSERKRKQEVVAGWRVLGEQKEWIDQQRSATKKMIVH
jgi:hypothetical protein